MSGSISQFEGYCRSFDFTEDQKAAAWESLRKAKIGPEDPEAIRIILHHLMSGDLSRFREATSGLLNDAREAIAGAAKETTERVARTAAKVERASSEKMAAHQAELISSVGTSIATSADHAMTRRIAVLSRNTLAAWLLTAFVVSAGTWAVGYRMGQANVTATSVEVSAMLQREDGAAWKSIMATNNLQTSLATYCKPGSQRVKSVDGGTYCELPLWLAREGVVSPVPHQPAEGNAIVAAAGNWLAGWGPWWLLAAGAVGLLLVRKLIAGAVSLRPVRWLFDLPPLPRTLEAAE